MSTPLDIAELSFLGGQELEWVGEIGNALRRRNAVLFAGAGLSLNAVHAQRQDGRLPLWQDLRAMFLKRLPGVPAQTEVLAAAELYERAFGRVSLVEALQEAIPDHDFEPGEVHRLTAQLDWHDIITTNYDTLVERAIQNLGVTPHVVVDESDLVLPGRPRVVKIAGCLKKSTFRLLITGEDYRTYPQTHPLLLNFLRECFVEHLVVFVGFSLQDPLFRAVHGWVYDKLGRLKRPAYSIQMGIDPLTKDFWRDVGIRVVDLSSGVPPISPPGSKAQPLSYETRMRRVLLHLRRLLLDDHGVSATRATPPAPPTLARGAPMSDTVRAFRGIVSAHLRGESHILCEAAGRVLLLEIVEEQGLTSPDQLESMDCGQGVLVVLLAHVLLIAWTRDRRFGRHAIRALAYSTAKAASEDGLCQSLILSQARFFGAIRVANDMLVTMTEGRPVGSGLRSWAYPPEQRFLLQHCYGDPRTLRDEYLKALDSLRLQTDAQMEALDEVFWRRYHLLTGYLHDYEGGSPRLLLRRERASTAGRVAERKALLRATRKSDSDRLETLLLKLHNGKRLHGVPIRSIESLWASPDRHSLPWELVIWFTCFSDGTLAGRKRRAALRRLVGAGQLDLPLLFDLFALRLSGSEHVSFRWRDNLGRVSTNDTARFFEGAAAVLEVLVPFVEDGALVETVAAVVNDYARVCSAVGVRSSLSRVLAALTHQVGHDRRRQIQRRVLESAVEDGELPLLNLSLMRWDVGDKADPSLVRAVLLKALLPQYQGTDFAWDVKRWALHRHKSGALEIDGTILVDHFSLLVAENVKQDLNWIVLAASAREAGLSLDPELVGVPAQQDDVSVAYCVVERNLLRSEPARQTMWRRRQAEYLGWLEAFCPEMSRDLFDRVVEYVEPLDENDVPIPQSGGVELWPLPHREAVLGFFSAARDARRVFAGLDEYRREVVPLVTALIASGATAGGKATRIADLLDSTQVSCLENNLLRLWRSSEASTAASAARTALHLAAPGVSLSRLIDRLMAAALDSAPELREAGLGCLLVAVQSSQLETGDLALRLGTICDHAAPVETDVLCRRLWAQIRSALEELPTTQRALA